jgi:putative endonuclease
MARVLRAIAGMPDDPRQLLGKSGEEVACDELSRRGYAILERRYRTRHGEIDIIARHQDCIVFVEVKTRTGEDYGGGAVAVTAWKQRRVAQIAVDYLARRRLHDRPCRFDVVIVDCSSGQPRIDVLAGAFDAPF